MHDHLERGLRQAREAASRRDFQVAGKLAADAFAQFSAHRSVEEADWMPIYAERCGPFEPNLAPRVLLRDHALIAGLFAQVPLQEGLALVDLLEDLAGALEHHDIRERRGFKTALDAVLSDAERTALLAAHDAAMDEAGVPEVSDFDRWLPTPKTAITPVREALLDGRWVPVSGARPPKMRRQLERAEAHHGAGERVDALERLRRVGWMLAAQSGQKV